MSSKTWKLTNGDLINNIWYKINTIVTVIATTQPKTQNKTEQLGWSGIIFGKKTTTTDVITF